MVKNSIFNTVKTSSSGEQFLINTRTTSVLNISKPPLQQLGDLLIKGGEQFVFDVGDSSIQLLKKNGFIVENEFDEKGWVEQIHQTARLGSDAFGLGIALTLACNFRCVYCYEKHIDVHISNELCSSINKFVSRNIIGKKRFRVAWFGGEPLLQTRLIEKFSNFFITQCDIENVKYSARIATNGYLLSRGTAEMLRRYHVDEIQITIDGPPEIHDERRFRTGGFPSFSRILNNIEKNCELFERVIVRINIDEHNRHSIPTLLEKYLYPLRNNIVLNFREALPPDDIYKMEPLTTLPDDYWNLEKDLGRLSDSLGFTVARGYALPCTSFCMGYQKNSFMIDPFGHIHRCTKYLGVKDERYGELSDHGEIIVNKTGSQASWDNWSPFKDNECISCKELPLCMGGCLLYLETKKDKKNTHRCFAKHNLLESVQRDVDISVDSIY
ncbi:MAG: radical SAM protein [Candidatus Electrothrix sp. YB6]